MPLALVALLGTAGCVSVPAGSHGPAPAASGYSRNVPTAQASPVPSAPTDVHDVLERTEGQPHKKDDGKQRKGESDPRRDTGTAEPPAREEEARRPQGHALVRQEPRGAAPAPRGADTGPPSAPRPQQTYDMRTVCAAGRGVASAGIVDLCRTAYGH
ncbi:hypothetical protein OG909_31705 [Streptomyces sp. NBC_01754]|uniref:hypothetical protein n=1 Tax=Streptomyces sp. NBC_01754 TaxID=2975930 RepID=UPI002DD8955A|nr:hypothetical protein [Streptomyces sp. NBC_01754]WSC96510.1 hypothetical protein OG909_31705 [Streptomyces sp. NBC_01754]